MNAPRCDNAATYVFRMRRSSSKGLTELRIADHTEKELLTLLALQEPTYSEIDSFLAKYDK
jgi:uncharacterized protein YbgA (DUF1722 family)